MPTENEPVDLGNEATSGDFAPDAAPASGPVLAYDPASGGLGNDPADIGNDPLSAPVVIAAAPALGTVLGPFQVGYAPDANAACTVTPGTLDSANNFTPTGPALGPYAASVTTQGGVYFLTMTVTDALSAGAVSIQPGDFAGGVFAAIGPAILGTLKLDADAPPDLSLSAGPPLVSLSPPEPRLLAAAAGFVHVRMSAANAADGSPVDLTLMPVSLAVTTGSPQTGDYEAGDWLTVTAPDAPAGTYARLAVGPNTLTAGVYFVDVMTAGLTVRAGGILLVN